MMALSKLSFTKDWKNPSDFPTYEPYETQVRADLQILFDEIKTFLNSLIDTLESGGASANVGVTLGEASMNLQAALNSLYMGQSNRYTKQEVTSLIGEASNNLVENIEYTPNTGVFSIKKKDGTTSSIDTVIEKVPANFELLEESGVYYLKVTNQDGSYSKTDVSTLMQIFAFVASPDISWSVTGEGVTKTVTATVRANSIGPDKLSPDVTTMLENYVAEAESAMNTAVSAKQSAAASQSEAETAAETATARATESATESKKSESYAVGGTGTRQGEDTDNAMYYKQQAALAKADSVAAKNAAVSAQSAAETAQSSAEQAKSEAAAARDAAVTAKNAAETAQSAAETAQSAAETARDESILAKDESVSAKLAAETARNESVSARDESVSAKEYSVAAKEAAETAKNESISAKEDAIAAKTAAETARDQAQEIAGGDFATKTELNEHVANTDVHVTADEKTAWNKKDVFVATYGTTTNAEIEAAYQSGKPIVLNLDEMIIIPFMLISQSVTKHIFLFMLDNDRIIIYRSIVENDVWNLEIYLKLVSTNDFDNLYNVLDDKKANKSTISTSTMSASGWSNGVYSFEADFPVATYDIEVALDSTATSEQAEAFNGAQIVGSATSNVVKAYGVVPTIDIPIIIKAVVK